MIKRLPEKPEGFFLKLPDHYMWFGLFNENGTYAYVGIEIISIWASFHMYVVKWSHNIVKSLKVDWEDLIELCKAHNVTTVIASNADINDKRWAKFIRLFGFPEPQLILMSQQEI